MRVTFVGHAGALIETSAGGILMDPWLRGPAFDRAWELIEPSYMPEEMWSKVSWIWFSHAHPDHFNTASIRSIPTEHKARVTALFQRTQDRAVVRWLASQDIKTREIDWASELDLGPRVRIYMEDCGVYDSWLAIKDGEQTVLNLNDCALVPSELRRVAQKLGKIDALMTQFSYASWPGNSTDPMRARAASASYLAKLRTQVEILRPVVTIPTASFVRFSHAENAWMNAYRSRPADAVEHAELAGARPVLLRPGDTWDVGADWDNKISLVHYEHLFAVPLPPPHRHPSLSREDVPKLANAFAVRLRSQNNLMVLYFLRAVLGWLRPINVLVKDLGAIATIDPLKGSAIWREEGVEAAFSCHSSALRLLLMRPWGLDTFLVAGRFDTTTGNASEVHNSFNVANLNNAGIRLAIVSLLSPTLLKKFWRIALPWLAWQRQQSRR